MVQQTPLTDKPHHFQIRFNTKHGDSLLVWRIFDNGEEVLATGFTVKGSMYSEATMEHGVVKYNVACDGYLTIDEFGHAYIAP